MRHVFLVNPAAGKSDQTARYEAAVRAAFSGRDEPHEILVSRGPGHLREMARDACAAGGEVRLYACGGDGTLNEVVNGAADFPNGAVTHFPGGSGNDFIKIFSDPAAFSDLPRLLDGDETRFDLIRAGTEQWALNVCSVGFDARIGTEIARYKRWPLVTGKGAYVISAAVNTVRGIHQPLEVVVDGTETFSGEYTMAYVGNGSWYGGSFHPVPEARPDDGLLELLLVRPVSRLTVLRVIGKYRRGLYAQYPQYILHRRCRSVTLRGSGPMAVNLDGELLRLQEVDVSAAPGRLRFFYPRGLTWATPENESNPEKSGEIVR